MSSSSTISRPPGRNAPASLRSTASRSGMWISSSRVCTKSKASRGSSSVTRSICHTSSSSNGSSSRTSTSAATTSPVRSCSQRANDPPPAPASRQRMPGGTPSASARRMLAGSWQASSRSSRSRACCQRFGSGDRFTARTPGARRERAKPRERCGCGPPQYWGCHLRSDPVRAGNVIPGDTAEGVELLRFARALSAAPSLEDLKQRFLVGFGRLVGMPMYGYALLDPVTNLPTCVANGNVSATFVARYERHAKDVDPLIEHAYRTGLTTYNLALMSPEEWVESAVYRHAYCVHGMRHVVEIPVTIGGTIAGNVHFATTAQEWDIGGTD